MAPLQALGCTWAYGLTSEGGGSLPRKQSKSTGAKQTGRQVKHRHQVKIQVNPIQVTGESGLETEGWSRGPQADGLGARQRWSRRPQADGLEARQNRSRRPQTESKEDDRMDGVTVEVGGAALEVSQNAEGQAGG